MKYLFSFAMLIMLDLFAVSRAGFFATIPPCVTPTVNIPQVPFWTVTPTTTPTPTLIVLRMTPAATSTTTATPTDTATSTPYVLNFPMVGA